MKPGTSIRVISLDGELEIGRREEIGEKLRITEADGAVLIDLSGATYADSTTLAALLRLRADAASVDVPIAVVVTNHQMTRLMQYAAIGDVIRIFGDRGDALRALSGS